MKILAVANAHALAHVSRLLEIAKVLRELGHSIVFAGHGKYLTIAEWDGFETRELPYISVEQVVRAVRSQRLWELYRENELIEFIQAERRLYESERPDLVLIDNRPTARTSAEQAGIKTAAVLNVHMSNYRRIPFFSVRNIPGLNKLPGAGVADKLENMSECLIYDRLVMGGLNAIRRKAGLSRLYAYEHEEGDLTLLADVPEFNPANSIPAHATYVGPLTWHNTLAPPACLNRLDPKRPTVYLSLGSEGLEDMVGHLGLLSKEGIQVVVALGAANLSPNLRVPDGVHLERYVNADALLPHCDLVCCHGGNGTLYQALSHGLPAVVVATHAEQHYGGKRMESLGLGRTTTLKRLRKQGWKYLVEMIQTVLGTSHYQVNAAAFSEHLKGQNSAQRAAGQITSLLQSLGPTSR
ncbi:MAG: glycosyltransferase [Burkholderiales bacterium]